MTGDLPVYLSLTSAYAGLGMVFAVHLRPRLEHLIQYRSGAVSDIPQAAITNLVPLVCQDTWVKDQFSAAKTHRNNLASYGPQSDRGSVKSAEGFVAQNDTRNQGSCTPSAEIGHAL